MTPPPPKGPEHICFCRSGKKTQVDICLCKCCEHEWTMLGNVHLFNYEERTTYLNSLRKP